MEPHDSNKRSNSQNSSTQQQNVREQEARLKQDAEQMKTAAKEESGKLADDVKQQSRDTLDQQKNTAAEEAEELSGAAEDVAAALDEHDLGAISDYTRQLASQMDDLSGSLRNKSIDELSQDARRLARDNPGLMIVGGLAVGFGLSRFLKASDRHQSAGRAGLEQQWTNGQIPRAGFKRGPNQAPAGAPERTVGGATSPAAAARPGTSYGNSSTGSEGI